MAQFKNTLDTEFQDTVAVKWDSINNIYTVFVNIVFLKNKLWGLEMKPRDFLIRFLPSISPDVVTNILYVESSGSGLTYDSPSWDVGNEINNGYVYVNLGDYVGALVGNYDIGVAAKDKRGNQSDMSILLDVLFDFEPPEPPGPIEIV